jgi:hypothetical protein
MEASNQQQLTTKTPVPDMVVTVEWVTTEATTMELPATMDFITANKVSKLCLKLQAKDKLCSNGKSSLLQRCQKMRLSLKKACMVGSMKMSTQGLCIQEFQDMGSVRLVVI